MHWRELKRLRLAEESAKKSGPKLDPSRPPIDLPEYAIHLFRKKRYKVIWGGRGGARSWTVARALLVKAAEQKLRILCAREMQSSLRDSVHQLLRDQIDLMHLPGFRVTDREIRHSNGSLFLFEGLRHNIAKIKSLEGIDICWVEEAERISNRSWQVLIPTIRKDGSEIWVTFNPDQLEDATYQRMIVHPPKDQVWQQKVSWEDNPWLSIELRNEKNYAYEVDPEGAEHIWGGSLRMVTEAQILRNKWTVKEFTVPRDTRGDPIWNGPYQGEDFGFGVDPSAAVRCWVGDQTLYIEYEMYQHKLELDDTAQALTDAIPDFADYVTRADSSRPDSISYLKRHGVPRIKGVVKTAGSVEDGIAHLRQYRMIVIHPRCKHTIDECKLYSYKVDQNSGDVLPIIVDKHNHLIDSIRYALQPMIKQRRLAGFLFVNSELTTLCPTCESRLPDDGECPHCGALVDMATGALIDPSDRDDVGEFSDAPSDADIALRERVHALTVREPELASVLSAPDPDLFVLHGHNGTEHHNGNGKRPRANLRDIND